MLNPNDPIGSLRAAAEALTRLGEARQGVHFPEQASLVAKRAFEAVQRATRTQQPRFGDIIKQWAELNGPLEQACVAIDRATALIEDYRDPANSANTRNTTAGMIFDAAQIAVSGCYAMAKTIQSDAGKKAVEEIRTLLYG